MSANLVADLDLLGRLSDLEQSLREAASVELAQGEASGPMRAAHDRSITLLLDQVRALAAKVP